jgi:hypothetical protein
MTPTTTDPRPTDDATPMPCPFCGEAPDIGAGGERAHWNIECLNGGCPVNPHLEEYSKILAVKLWNTRAPDATLAAVTAERDALLRFKQYVHKRLDDAGVTVDPESAHKAEGCRIGGRLDEVLDERHKLRQLVFELMHKNVAALAASANDTGDAGRGGTR